ncbi:hypothetical protein T440DRAFT_493642 [Plenodomus tracheiphilus IPT5]|uniref:Tachykinin family protein n=1 Tax=Plenodomus tracheiphilus IPT5 TaxID=1408161 RepID=A0A6A7ARZ6_9PLEO|nr:hypothetical protein T440DRAFT_493642 [Plenodomus tracheiphilus IPT5]
MDDSTKPSFNFINLKHPDDLKDEEMQLRIRRLAMTEVGKARRRPKTKRERTEFILEFHEPEEKRVAIERFGSTRFDPFGHYPIELDDSARALLTHIFSPDTNHPSQLRGSWYPVSLSSPAAFHNVLANSQNYLFQKMNGYFPSQDDHLALAHRHKALIHANEMMKDTLKHTSDEMIGTVASFLCHLALLGSFGNGDWAKHRNALVRIIGLRGGYDTIDKESLRCTITWVDLIGCFAQDLPPVVPMPHPWLQNSSSRPFSPRPSIPIALLWKQQLPSRLDWITVFDDIVQLISQDRAFNLEQLVLAITSGSWIEPTIYRLLTIRPLHLGHDREHVMEEVCRLGTLLFLAPFWRLLGHSPIWTAAISRNLLHVLMSNMVEWNELKPLLIWVLYFASVETNDLAERSQFLFMLAVLMASMQLREWEGLMDVVKSVLWVEKVFAGTEELIKEEVVQIVGHGGMGTPLVEARLAFLEQYGGNVE